MRIAILGAGAMGSLFGARLAEHGEAVTLIDVNDAHLDAIRRDGLRIDDDRGERRIRTLQAVRPEAANAAAGAAPDAPFDLLIVFTKALHTCAALEGVHALLTPRTSVLTLQNGLGNVEALNTFVPLERILVGVTTWPADFAGAGHVRSHGAGTIRMMTADGAPRPFAAAVADALSRAGLACSLDADVWAAIWEKVAFNAALNTLCAATAARSTSSAAIPKVRGSRSRSPRRRLPSRARKASPWTASVSRAMSSMRFASIAAIGHRCCRTCSRAAAPRSARSTVRSSRPRTRRASRCRTSRRCSRWSG